MKETAMTMIKVYNYKECDRLNGSFSFSEYPATREYIEGRGRALEIIEGSEKEVDISKIDDKGRVKPKP